MTAFDNLQHRVIVTMIVMKTAHLVPKPLPTLAAVAN